MEHHLRQDKKATKKERIEVDDDGGRNLSTPSETLRQVALSELVNGDTSGSVYRRLSLGSACVMVDRKILVREIRTQPLSVTNEIRAEK
eukprot:CAMPEP_0113302776 /NCGR_PEP_ID=MMETSP0010_2-20120614/3464_1 /TAXON_ID=216773 ORGANISM="Corethron hystrix, Strain 308" /NCGR_SAMPLE_ID=MMETSP0010_2 /ASSEMBLY_ACC=CAM_ASM_000155 /LENGTH=88 /DNA_ID=CAMNT_0000156655 /DNA_START=65 /DNA_END=331 /DNA_ORIENTATION=- /assembly_acc=CAM_ASM_000155